jgi:branched-subunit amino acid aminotransferase/4-amino-4-deoxychorismate lyase
MIDFDTGIWKITGPTHWELQDRFLLNRGFLFGDGVFETMVFTEGSIRFSSLHQERILRGCKVLGLDTSSLTDIRDVQQGLIDRLGAEKQVRIRWMVFRNGFGKYTPETNSAVELVQVQPLLKPIKIKEMAYFSSWISVPTTPWSHCKTINALTYVMANKERQDRGMDEVILLSPNGYISEAGSSNIFWIKNQEYFTPSLSCNGISGIGRRMIIDQLRQAGKSITEGEYLPEELLEADQVFTSNVTGISYLKAIDQKCFDVKEIELLENLFTL